MRTLDIIVKTHPPDYDWLPYLFRSISMYARGYRNLVVLLEEQYPEPDWLPAGTEVARSRRYVDTDISSNVGAVIERLRAWAYTDAERFLFVDSDCVFIRTIDFQTDQLICIEKPALYWRTWEEAGEGAYWKPYATETLGYAPKLETMPGYPFCYTRDVMRGFWDFVGGAEGLAKVEHLTDWNAIGNYALDHMSEQVTKRHASELYANPCVRQFWSFDRANNPKVQDELRGYGLAP